jgi:tetratricopeptide (TPR) repeat protein
VLARAHSRLGRPGAADGLARRAAALGEQLVLGPDSAELAAQDATATASVLLTAGDVREAAAVLDEGEAGLRRIGAQQLCPPVWALSARVRHRMGDFERAHRLLDDCDKRTPPDDVAVQASQRGVRALLLADQGDYVVAEQLARSAMQASDWSERLDVQAQARADLVNVLVRSGRLAEAALPAAWALRLCERKGDVVLAGAVRELLPPGEAAEVWPFRPEAWVMAQRASLVAGRTARIGMRLLRQDGAQAGLATATRQQEVLVTLTAGSAAAVRPHGQRLRLPRSGYTQTLVFRVTPKEPRPLRLQFQVNLYEEGTLLQEMGVTMPVLPRDTGTRRDE